MTIFDSLMALDWRRFWWSIDQDGFDVYVNCNDLHKGTSFGLCLYRGVYGEPADVEAVIQEGLLFLEDFLTNHKKDLDLFYETYTFVALDDFITILVDFKSQYPLKFDSKSPPINPFR